MTTPTPRTLARLRELIDAYGAALERIPDAGEREAARALVECDTAAAELLTEARALDTLLDAAAATQPSAALRARVAEIPIRHPHAAPDAWLDWLSWRGALRVLLAGAIAAAAGAASATLSVDEEMMATADDGWDDVTAVAFATGIEEEP